MISSENINCGGKEDRYQHGQILFLYIYKAVTNGGSWGLRGSLIIFGGKGGGRSWLLKLKGRPLDGAGGGGGMIRTVFT